MIDEIKARKYLDRAAIAITEALEREAKQYYNDGEKLANLAAALATLINTATYQAEASISASKEF